MKKKTLIERLREDAELFVLGWVFLGEKVTDQKYSEASHWIMGYERCQ